MERDFERLYKIRFIVFFVWIKLWLVSYAFGWALPRMRRRRGNQSCKIARCSLQHGKPEYCSRCQEFPYEKYENIDEFDSFVTHQNQKKDLEKQQKIGAEEYRAEQEEKIRILEWLLQTCNDGRKKTFFCVAVNLLELEDVRNVMGQIKSDGKIEELSLKERAAYVTGQFQKAADTQGIVLKLRKKK